MKKLILWVMCSASFSLASESFVANIRQGNINTAGSFRLDQYSGNRDSTFDLSATVGYFVWDRISLGISGSVYDDDNNDTVAIAGPIAQYFVWNEERAAVSLALGYGHGLTDATISGRVQSRAAFHYFSTDSVAFGPFVDYSRILSRYGRDYNRFGVGVTFGIYL